MLPDASALLVESQYDSRDNSARSNAGVEVVELSRERITHTVWQIPNEVPSN